MKRKMMALVLSGIMAVSLCACGGGGSSSQASSGSAAGDTGASSAAGSEAQSAPAGSAAPEATGSETAGGDYNISFVLHSLSGSFYTKLAEGAEAAGKDLGVNVTVSAPNTPSSLDEQVSLLETAISSGADAIATVTWDPSGFNNVISQAKDAGIPVVAFNQNAEDCGSVCFIGQDYESAGYSLGKYMFEQMGGKGSYIVASCGPTDVALVAREAGIDRAAEEYPDVKKITTIDIGTDLTNAYSVIENAYLANPDVNAILGVDVFSEAIGSFIEDYDLSGKVYAAGFDLTEGMLGHIKNGSVQLTVGQNPFLQGYYSVYECYMGLKYGADYLDVDTGAQMVTSENVNDVEPE